MTKPAMTWDEMHADPEFQMLTPAAQELVRQQYLRSAGGPAKAVSKPAPKPSPLAPYLPKMPAKAPAYSSPTKEALGSIIKANAAEGFKQTVPGVLGDKAVADAQALTPNSQKPLSQLLNESQARRLDPKAPIAPRPTLPQQLKAAVKDAADTAVGAYQNLSTGNEGLGEGVAAGLSNLAGQMADPTALLTDGLAGKGAASLIAKGAKPTLAKGAAALGSGLAQGSAFSVAANDPSQLGPDALMAGLLNVATAGKAGNTAKTLERLKTALGNAKTPKAKASIQARIDKLQVLNGGNPTPQPSNIIPFPDQAPAVARLVGDQAGELRPQVLLDKLPGKAKALDPQAEAEALALKMQSKGFQSYTQWSLDLEHSLGHEVNPDTLYGIYTQAQKMAHPEEHPPGSDEILAMRDRARQLRAQSGPSLDDQIFNHYLEKARQGDPEGLAWIRNWQNEVDRSRFGDTMRGYMPAKNGEPLDARRVFADPAAVAPVASGSLRKATPEEVKAHAIDQEYQRRLEGFNDGNTNLIESGAWLPGQDARAKLVNQLPPQPDLSEPVGKTFKPADPGVIPRFRDLLTDESGQFDLNAFLSGVKRQVNDLTKRADELRQEGRNAEATDLMVKANDLRDVRAIAEQRPATPPDAQSIDATKYYNPNKYDFASNDAILKFDELTRQAVAERGMDPKARIPQSEILRRAGELTGERLDDLKNKKLKFGQSLTAVEYEAAKNTLQQLVTESADLEQRIRNAPRVTPDDLAAVQQMEVQLHQMEKDAKGFMDVIIPSRSQKGRDLAYLKMVAQQGFSADYWTARAYRVSGGAVPQSQMSVINRAIAAGAAAEAAGNAAGVRQARIDLAKAMGKLERTGALEAASALRKAGLLTGVKTIGRNMVGTWGYQALEEAAHMPAWMLDWAVANAPLVGTGHRTVARPSLSKVGAGLNEARTRGVQEFGEVMIHGMPLDQLANLEIPKEINTGVAPFDFYVNTVFRFQSAQDRLAKAYAMKRSILDQAELKAINERHAGQHGPDVSAMARYYAANPTPEMLTEAIADADFATFTNDTELSKFLTEGLAKRTPKLKFAFDLVMPFKKTPLAVASRILEYSGIEQAVGSLTPGNYAQIIREGLTPAQQKSIALGFGRGAVGGSLIAMGFWLAQNGMMTGTYDPERRDVDQAAGRTPASIKVNGQWVSLQALSPIGNLMTLGATLERMGEAGMNAADAPGAYGALAAKTVLDQPMTQGASQVVDLARDPEKSLPKFGASLAGSMVPSLAGEIAQSMDTVERQTSTDWPQAAIDTMQRKDPFPGGRQELPAKLTPLGETIPAPNGLNAFNIFAGRPALEDTNPVVREMVRINPKIPRVPDTLKAGGRELALSPELKRDYQERVGAVAAQNIRQLLADPEYLNNDHSTQTDWMEAAFGDARQRVKVQMIRERQGEGDRTRRAPRHHFRREENQ